ncbi:hypothetical protein [Baekduia soli]|nr:hypothetical protein [Baekduia soli]
MRLVACPFCAQPLQQRPIAETLGFRLMALDEPAPTPAPARRRPGV